MHISIFIRWAAGLMSVIALGLLAAGCDNPVETNGHDHAEDVEGLTLSTEEGELVLVEGGLTDDTLWVPLDGTTAEIFVEFLDHDGEEIHAEDLEEDFELGWTIADTGVLALDQQDTWSFVLEGLTADTTELEIQLLHLPQRHEDFTTPRIPVVVR